MRAQSQVRIAGRRQSALARRQRNLKQVQSPAGVQSGCYDGLSEESRGKKLGVINTDIENLNKKGVRA